MNDGDRYRRPSADDDDTGPGGDADSETDHPEEPFRSRSMDRSGGEAHVESTRDDGGDDGGDRPRSSDPDDPKKLHPLSIPYRVVQSGMGIVPLVFVLGIVAVPALGPIGPVLAVLLAIGGFAVVIGWHVAYYRRFSYLTTSDTFDIRSGVLSRRHREIPYRRIQNVDISRNLVQRALGIAQLDIETAGGSQTEASLRYIGYDEAKRLQDELYRRKRRADTAEATEPDRVKSTSEHERVLYAITPSDLLVLAVASMDLRILSFLGVLLSIVSPPFLVELVTGLPVSPIVVIAGILVGLAIVSAIVSGTNAVFNTFGFVLSQRGDELRYERGLIQRYDGSIPLDKVQTLAFRENFLKRRFGYSTLAIETAGYAPGRGDARIGSESAVPIARRELTWAIGRAIEPFGEISLERPPKRARTRYAVRYLLAIVALSAAMYAITWYFDAEMYWPVVFVGFSLTPIAAHYKWRSRGYYIGSRYAVTRSGFWQRVTRVVPAYRVQTVIETQSVFQRRWHLASVTIDTAGTSSLIGGDATAYDLDRSDARAVRETVAGRLREALNDRITVGSRSVEVDTYPDETRGPDQSAPTLGRRHDRDRTRDGLVDRRRNVS